jgi:hypothetical protein
MISFVSIGNFHCFAAELRDRSAESVVANMQNIESKPPFSQYANLPGLEVVYGNPTDPGTYPEGGFDIVYDNNGKSLKECQALIDTYASNVRHSSFPR